MFHNGRYANVTATLALILAMGGTSYAAISLPRNSVGTAQIRPAAVKTADLGASSVTSTKVKNHSLQAHDFAFGQIPAGAQGPVGPQGEAGTAAAYARVLPTGVSDGALAHNVVGGAVSHPSTGVYCIGGLMFKPRSAIATIDDHGPVAASTGIASVAVYRGAGPRLPGCDPDDEVRITTTQLDAGGTSLADRGFFVWLERDRDPGTAE